MAEDKLTEEIKDTIGGQFYGWYIFVHYYGHYTYYMVYTECEKGHPYLVEEVSKKVINCQHCNTWFVRLCACLSVTMLSATMPNKTTKLIVIPTGLMLQ